MSDLTPVGVQLVAEGAQPFDKAILGASKALGVLEKAGQAAAKGMGTLDQIVVGALRRIGEMGVDALVRAGRELARFGSRLLQAAVDGTALDSTLEKLYRSAVDVTRTSLNPFFEQFDGLIQRVAPKVLGFGAVLGQVFGNIGQNALTWGENVIGQFAQGMLNAAVYVLDALISIGNVITGWLMPGSPPKLLPDLDKWGTEAANVWLEGWTKANFSIFTGLAGPLEALIRSTAAPGGKDAGLIPRILGSREGIARAVEELRTAGSVSQATLDNIIAQVGTADAGVRAFLEATIGLEAANRAVTAAQDNLNRVLADYNALLKPIEDQLAGIDEATKQFDEDQQKRMLALVLADPNATAAEKRRAQLELERIDAERARRALLAEKADAVDAAQTELDAAEAAAAAAQTQYDAQLALLQLQTEQNNLLKEQLTLLEKLAAVVSGAGPKGGGGGPKSVFGVDMSGALETLELLKGKFDELYAAWKPTIDKIVAFVTDQFSTALSTVELNLTAALAALDALWTQHGEFIVTTLFSAFAILTTVLSIGLTLLSGVLTAGLQILSGDWDGAAETWQRTVASANKQISRLLQELFGETIQDTDDYFELLKYTWDTSWRDIFETTGGWTQDISDALAEWLNQTAEDLIIGFGRWLTNTVQKLDELTQAFVDHLFTPITNLINGLLVQIGVLEGKVGSAQSNGTSHPTSTANNITSSVVTNNASNVYNYAPNYGGAPNNPSVDFALMQVWAS